MGMLTANTRLEFQTNTLKRRVFAIFENLVGFDRSELP